MNLGQSIVSCTKMLMVMVRSSNLDGFVDSGRWQCKSINRIALKSTYDPTKNNGHGVRTVVSMTDQPTKWEHLTNSTPLTEPIRLQAPKEDFAETSWLITAPRPNQEDCRTYLIQRRNYKYAKPFQSQVYILHLSSIFAFAPSRDPQNSYRL